MSVRCDCSLCIVSHPLVPLFTVTQHSAQGLFFQSELMVEICSKSLVRAIDKVLHIKYS